jgi:DNA-binding NarL/FixJ family response regulator
VISVVIVDDHPIVRAGIRSVLQGAGDIAILGEGASGAEAVRLVSTHHPDVLLLDVNLPDVNGCKVTRQVGALNLHTAILILTVHKDAQTVFNLLECGATGYVLKDEALETLANAVRAVARGESWLSPPVAFQVVQRATGQAVPSEPVIPALTDSELRVLSLLAEGLDNGEIAHRLVVTKRTVQNHVSNIYGKLGVKSRTEAMLYAIQHGLTHLPPATEASHEP